MEFRICFSLWIPLHRHDQHRQEQQPWPVSAPNDHPDLRNRSFSSSDYCNLIISQSPRTRLSTTSGARRTVTGTTYSRPPSLPRRNAHIQSSIKKPKTARYPSLKGVDPKFRRNHRHALHGNAKALVRDPPAAPRSATRIQERNLTSITEGAEGGQARDRINGLVFTLSSSDFAWMGNGTRGCEGYESNERFGQ